MEIHIKETHRGPIFSPLVDAIIPAFLLDITDQVGDMAVDTIQRGLDGVLKHPTGVYRSNIRAHRGGGNVIVDDGDIVYGDWLEGVSDRNSTTRFKGYHTFRRMTPIIDRKAGEMAQNVFATKYLGRFS